MHEKTPDRECLRVIDQSLCFRLWEVFEALFNTIFGNRPDDSYGRQRKINLKVLSSS